MGFFFGFFSFIFFKLFKSIHALIMNNLLLKFRDEAHFDFNTTYISKYMQRIYELGARRVLVTGTGPLGCVPAELAQHSVNGECAVELQRASALFNPQLVQMINGLNSEVGSDVFIAANTNEMHLDFIANPQQYGMYALTCL